MKNVHAIRLLLPTLLLFSLYSFGQNSTFTEVHNIMRTYCAGSGCHSGSRPDFNVNDTGADLHNSLVNALPFNPAAKAKGDKLVDPGYPHRSFLLRKVANCIHTELVLDQPDEGAPMPNEQPPLKYHEIELIRQWILYGAPQSGTVVDYQMLKDFYGGNALAQLNSPPPPDSCAGFQIHMGPVFLKPNEEKEFFLKFDPQLPDDKEIYRIDVSFDEFSHHFIIYKFAPNTEQNWPEGLELLDPFSAFDSDKEFVLAWQNDDDIELPNGTAYFWDSTTVLDLNYHLRNYDQSKILAGEVYLNIYTQPKGTALKEMKAALVNKFVSNIQPNTPITFSGSTTPDTDISVWTLSSHTHKYGTDYDIYVKNPNGSQGSQVYEGQYDYINGFHTGVFDWQHPPIRFFEPFLQIQGTQNEGLIHEASYLNTGNTTVNFGFTTEDEMMIMFVQYVEGNYSIPNEPVYTPCTPTPYVAPCTKTTAIRDRAAKPGALELNLWPNPFTTSTLFSYSLRESAYVHLELFDLSGKSLKKLADEAQAAGAYRYDIHSADLHGSGIYLLKYTINGESGIEKIVLVK